MYIQRLFNKIMTKILLLCTLVTSLVVLSVTNSFATSGSETSSLLDDEWDDRIIVIQRRYLHALEAYKIKNYKLAFSIWMPMANQ